MKLISVLFGSLLTVVLLSGCGNSGPEHQASFILKQQMKSPDSFHAKETKMMWQGENKDGHPAYVVKVTYTAQNSYGANLQDCKMVAFSMNGDQLSYNQRTGFDTCGVVGHKLLDPQRVAEIMSSQFEK